MKDLCFRHAVCRQTRIAAHPSSMHCTVPREFSGLNVKGIDTSCPSLSSIELHLILLLLVNLAQPCLKTFALVSWSVKNILPTDLHLVTPFLLFGHWRKGLLLKFNPSLTVHPILVASYHPLPGGRPHSHVSTYSTTGRWHWCSR